jgi:hypothetical protein
MVTYPYSLFIWQHSPSPVGECTWLEPVQCYTQEYALYLAALIHNDSHSAIKVVLYGLNIACFPDEHTVELLEQQIARQLAQ